MLVFWEKQVCQLDTTNATAMHVVTKLPSFSLRCLTRPSWTVLQPLISLERISWTQTMTSLNYNNSHGEFQAEKKSVLGCCKNWLCRWRLPYKLSVHLNIICGACWQCDCCIIIIVSTILYVNIFYTVMSYLYLIFFASTWECCLTLYIGKWF